MLGLLEHDQSTTHVKDIPVQAQTVHVYLLYAVMPHPCNATSMLEEFENSL